MINATGNRMTAEIRRQQGLSDSIARLQTQISSGLRLQRPSDDAVATARVSVIRQQQSDMAAWLSNLDLGISAMAQADGVLKTVSDLALRYRELTVAGASDSASAPERGTMAIELRAIASELDALQGTIGPTGEPLFPAGASMQLRVDASTLVPFMPGRASLFEVAGANISQMVRDAATALESGNDVAIDAALDAAGDVVSKIADGAASIGLDAARLDRIREGHLTRQIDTTAERKSLESTDLTQAIAELNATAITLEAAQAAFARINRRTLFDMLS